MADSDMDLSNAGLSLKEIRYKRSRERYKQRVKLGLVKGRDPDKTRETQKRYRARSKEKTKILMKLIEEQDYSSLEDFKKRFSKPTPKKPSVNRDPLYVDLGEPISKENKLPVLLNDLVHESIKPNENIRQYRKRLKDEYKFNQSQLKESKKQEKLDYQQALLKQKQDIENFDLSFLDEY